MSKSPTTTTKDNWEQGSFVGPVTTHLRLDLFFDGRMDFGGWALHRYDGDDMTLVATVCRPACPSDSVLLESYEALATATNIARGELSPF